MPDSLVVVGASLAGLRAVEAARRSGYSGSITMIGAESQLPYDRPPLSKAFLTDSALPDHLTDEDTLRRELGVDLLLSTRATSLDAAGHIVHTTAGPISYASLLLACGATARTLVDAPKLSGIVTLRTLEHAEYLRSRIRPGANVVVLGAGFIGSEIASSASKIGANVTIVEAAPVPLVRAVGSVVGAALADLHGRNGTRLLLSTSISSFNGDEAIESVTLSTGETIPADLVVVGIGAAPETSWLVDSGIELHPRDGGIVCDEYLQTSLPDVYAAGDVAHWPNAMLDETVRLENWTNAADQAAQAGVNAVAGSGRAAYTTVPYFWSDWYGHRIQFVGSADADAVEFVAGDDPDRFVALFRRGNRLIGAATLNERRKIMKLRRHIAERGDYASAHEIAAPAAAPVDAR